MGSAARAVDDSGAKMAIDIIRRPLSTHLRMPTLFPRVIIQSSLIYKSDIAPTMPETNY
jgi:hypothetical protein